MESVAAAATIKMSIITEGHSLLEAVKADNVALFMAITRTQLDESLHIVQRISWCSEFGALRCMQALTTLLPGPFNPNELPGHPAYCFPPMRYALHQWHQPLEQQLPCVRWLLEVGGDPNALYLLYHCRDVPRMIALGTLLIDYGARLLNTNHLMTMHKGYFFIEAHYFRRQCALTLRRCAVLTSMLSIQRAHPHVPVDVIRLIAQRYVFFGDGRHSWKAWMPEVLYDQ